MFILGLIWAITILAMDNNQLKKEKPPPRVCPRCNSNNTKFSYYNNYNSSQPRYSCKNCHRYWTHGGTLRNIPISGNNHKKRINISQPSISLVTSTKIVHQIHHHQHFLHVKENNEHFRSFVRSSSFVSTIIGNHYDALPGIRNEPFRSFRPIMNSLDYFKESVRRDYSTVESNYLTCNPLINQSTGTQVYNHNGYCMNQVYSTKWTQSFNGTTNMNSIRSTSGNKGSSVISKCTFGSFYHVKKHDP